MFKTDAVERYAADIAFLSAQAMNDLYLNTQCVATNAAVQSLYVLPGDTSNPVVYGDAQFVAVFAGRVMFFTQQVGEESPQTREMYTTCPAVEREESDIVLQYDPEDMDITNWTPWMTPENLEKVKIGVPPPYAHDEVEQFLLKKMNTVSMDVRIEQLNNNVPVALLVFIMPMPKTLPPPLEPCEVDSHDFSRSVYPAFAREITPDTDPSLVKTDKLFVSVTCSLSIAEDFFPCLEADDGDAEAAYYRHCRGLGRGLERRVVECVTRGGLL